MTRRARQLAMIHIAQKQLDMDDETYRAMLRSIARVDSSAELDHHGRERVIRHLQKCGARFTPSRRRRYQRGSQAALMAHIWSRLHRSGTVKDGSDRALRRWCKRQSATYHPDRIGYDGPELCPPGVAQRLIEHLKRWAEDQAIDLELRQ